MGVNPLIQAWDRLNEILEMTYDAAYRYNANDWFNVYQNIFKNKI
jgi:hypothetical protein